MRICVPLDYHTFREMWGRVSDGKGYGKCIKYSLFSVTK